MSSRRIKLLAVVILALGLGWLCAVAILGKAGMRRDWKYDELKTLRTEYATLERTLGRTHEETMVTQRAVANALLDLEKFAEAEKECREALATRGQVSGPDHDEMLTLHGFLSIALEGQGKNAEAEKELRTLVDGKKRTDGPEDKSTLDTWKDLAHKLSSHGKHAEAQVEYRAILAVKERVLGPDHFDVCFEGYCLAMYLEAHGKPKEALPFLQQAEAGFKKALGTRLGAADMYCRQAREARERIEAKLKKQQSPKGAK